MQMQYIGSFGVLIAEVSGAFVGFLQKSVQTAQIKDTQGQLTDQEPPEIACDAETGHSQEDESQTYQ